MRQYIEFRVIEEQAKMSGAATDDQVRALVIFFNEQYPDRRERIDALRWILNRVNIDSTKDLTKAESSVLISWSKTDESTGEAARVALAMRETQQTTRNEEQLGFFDDGGVAEQTINAIKGKIK